MSKPDAKAPDELQASPVSNTARMTLLMLASAGNRDAQALSERLGFHYGDILGWFEGGKDGSNTAGAREGLVSSEICVETRYSAMAALAEMSGYDMIIDLPCGYTPHSIEYARKGLHFIGLDLPVVISEAEGAALALAENKHLIDFAAADATDCKSLERALSGISRPVCITTEGFLMYFTDPELERVCQNIKNILTHCGGCWITADPESACQTIRTLKAVSGDRFQEILAASCGKVQSRKDTLMKRNSLVIDPSALPEMGIEKAMAFLSGFGLRAKRLMIADYMTKVKSINNLSPEKAAAVKENLKNLAYWSITAA